MPSLCSDCEYGDFNRNFKCTHLAIVNTGQAYLHYRRCKYYKRKSVLKRLREQGYKALGEMVKPTSPTSPEHLNRNVNTKQK